jgi:Holliday junction resolvase RusA-like endonuclease
MEVEITLTGRPTTKKNSQKIIVNPATGRPMVIPSRQYRLYEETCLWQLKTYRGPKFEDKLVNLKAVYYMPDKRSWPDLTGLLQATCDILERAEVIDNDRNFYSFDGSHVAGVDKHNPRVEITLTEVSV